MNKFTPANSHGHLELLWRCAQLQVDAVFHLGNWPKKWWLPGSINSLGMVIPPGSRNPYNRYIPPLLGIRPSPFIWKKWGVYPCFDWERLSFWRVPKKFCMVIPLCLPNIHYTKNPLRRNILTDISLDPMAERKHVSMSHFGSTDQHNGMPPNKKEHAYWSHGDFGRSGDLFPGKGYLSSREWNNSDKCRTVCKVNCKWRCIYGKHLKPTNGSTAITT